MKNFYLLAVLILIGSSVPMPSQALDDGEVGCVKLTQNLYRFHPDKADVRKLQRFLSTRPEAEWPAAARVNGFYGVTTEKAVQRFQSFNSIVTFGKPATTGYGMVGPVTRNFIATLTCGPEVELPAKIKNITLTSPAGGEVLITGRTTKIDWQTGRDYVDLYAVSASDSKLHQIAKNVSGGKYNWRGGRTATGSTLASGRYFVEACAVDRSVCSRSAESLLIAKRSEVPGFMDVDLKINNNDGPFTTMDSEGSAVWTSQFARNCVLSGAIAEPANNLAVTGTRDVELTGGAVTLTCGSQFGTSTDSIVVTLVDHGSFTVTLSPTTPPGGEIQVGQDNFTVDVFRLIATNEDVILKALALEYDGSNVVGIGSVGLWNNDEQVATGVFNSDGRLLLVPSVDVTVPKDSSIDLAVKIDLSELAVAGDTFRVKLDGSGNSSGLGVASGISATMYYSPGVFPLFTVVE